MTQFALNPITNRLDLVNSGAGDVVGPGSSTDNALVRWDGATGTVIKNSVAILTDAGVLTGLTAITVTGPSTLNGAQIVKTTSPVAYPYSVLSTDYIVLVNTSSARTINLPNAPTTNQVYIIKDVTGSAAANNISVTTPGGVVTIDGSTTYTMNINRGSITVVFDGSNYQVI